MSCCLRLSAWSLIWNSAAARMALRWKHILKVWHRMAWHWRKAFLKLGWTWSFLCFLCFLFCVFCDSLRLWASDPLFRSVLDAFHMQNLKQSSRVESLKIHRAKLWSRFGNAEISCWNVQRKQPCKVQAHLLSPHSQSVKVSTSGLLLGCLMCLNFERSEIVE